MYDTTEAVKKAYKPFDVVTCADGSVGFIQEVSINGSQSHIKHQLSYAVHWFVGEETKYAWWDHEELSLHCNLFVEIAKTMCHPFGSNKEFVSKLFSTPSQNTYRDRDEE